MTENEMLLAFFQLFRTVATQMKETQGWFVHLELYGDYSGRVMHEEYHAGKTVLILHADFSSLKEGSAQLSNMLAQKQ